MTNQLSPSLELKAPPRKVSAAIDFDPASHRSSILTELLESSIILPEDWEDLVDAHRQEIAACADKDALLALLVENRLLTQYQAERVDAGKTHGLILGNYRVLDRLGRGGMGTVFKGEHLRMRRLAAIKVLPLRPDTDERLLRRFLMEMRAIAQLKHPNIIEAIDDGNLAGAIGEPSVHFFIMEYVPGHDLDELVRENGALRPDQACSIAYQVASALAEAYQHNVVHRDIKPSNIRITADQQAKLLDFGLVRRLHHRLTDHGTILGTLDYIAPEQARDASAVDIRADIYGLGGTLFWCLTGRTPFQGNGSLAVNILRRMNQKAPSIRAVNPILPAELDALVARMMACNPEDRHPTPQTVMKALLPFLKSGSSDSFFLPPSSLDRRPSHPTQAQVAIEALSGAVAKPARGHRVLVADDMRMVRSFCAHSLHEAGIECDQVENGALALAAINSKPYDLLLTDWIMPEMSGLELCQKVRANPPSPNFKIILFSSEVTDDSVATMLAGGADDFLPKQFSPVQLVARVQAALRHKDLQDRSALLNRHLLACNHQMEDNLLARDSDLVQVRNALVLGLTDLVCRRDAENIQHVLRVQRFSRLLAEEATGVPSLADQIDKNFIAMLECCAPLHDIGKVALPDYILTKAGNFNAEEHLIMQTHTIIGAETLQNVAQRHGSAVAFLQMAIDIARHHHERFDGQGYPDRLRGNDIPLAARLVAICDVYDGLRTRRSYKPALGHLATLEMMLENSPGQFDPLLLQAFRRCQPEFERTYREMPG